jgi:hypothetical protein
MSGSPPPRNGDGGRDDVASGTSSETAADVIVAASGATGGLRSRPARSAIGGGASSTFSWVADAGILPAATSSASW